MKHPAIQEAWERHNKLRAEGNKLRAEGDEFRVEGDKLRAEGNKLYFGGFKLWADGGMVYCEAVIAAYGKNAVIDWTTGEIEVL